MAGQEAGGIASTRSPSPARAEDVADNRHLHEVISLTAPDRVNVQTPPSQGRRRGCPLSPRTHDAWVENGLRAPDSVTSATQRVSSSHGDSEVALVDGTDGPESGDVFFTAVDPVAGCPSTAEESPPVENESTAFANRERDVENASNFRPHADAQPVKIRGEAEGCSHVLHSDVATSADGGNKVIAACGREDPLGEIRQTVTAVELPKAIGGGEADLIAGRSDCREQKAESSAREPAETFRAEVALVRDADRVDTSSSPFGPEDALINADPTPSRLDNVSADVDHVHTLPSISRGGETPLVPAADFQGDSTADCPDRERTSRSPHHRDALEEGPKPLGVTERGKDPQCMRRGTHANLDPSAEMVGACVENEEARYPPGELQMREDGGTEPEGITTATVSIAKSGGVELPGTDTNDPGISSRIANDGSECRGLAKDEKVTRSGNDSIASDLTAATVLEASGPAAGSSGSDTKVEAEPVVQILKGPDRLDSTTASRQDEPGTTQNVYRGDGAHVQSKEIFLPNPQDVKCTEVERTSEAHREGQQSTMAKANMTKSPTAGSPSLAKHTSSPSPDKAEAARHHDVRLDVLHPGAADDHGLARVDALDTEVAGICASIDAAATSPRIADAMQALQDALVAAEVDDVRKVIDADPRESDVGSAGPSHTWREHGPNSAYSGRPDPGDKGGLKPGADTMSSTPSSEAQGEMPRTSSGRWQTDAENEEERLQRAASIRAIFPSRSRSGSANSSGRPLVQDANAHDDGAEDDDFDDEVDVSCVTVEESAAFMGGVSYKRFASGSSWATTATSTIADTDRAGVAGSAASPARLPGDAETQAIEQSASRTMPGTFLSGPRHDPETQRVNSSAPSNIEAKYRSLGSSDPRASEQAVSLVNSTYATTPSCVSVDGRTAPLASWRGAGGNEEASHGFGIAEDAGPNAHESHTLLDPFATAPRDGPGPAVIVAASESSWASLPYPGPEEAPEKPRLSRPQPAGPAAASEGATHDERGGGPVVTKTVVNNVDESVPTDHSEGQDRTTGDLSVMGGGAETPRRSRSSGGGGCCVLS